jgi:hypothetical protein
MKVEKAKILILSDFPRLTAKRKLYNTEYSRTLFEHKESKFRFLLNMLQKRLYILLLIVGPGGELKKKIKSFANRPSHKIQNKGYSHVFLGTFFGKSREKTRKTFR